MAPAGQVKETGPSATSSSDPSPEEQNFLNQQLIYQQRMEAILQHQITLENQIRQQAQVIQQQEEKRTLQEQQSRLLEQRLDAIQEHGAGSGLAINQVPTQENETPTLAEGWTFASPTTSPPPPINSDGVDEEML